MFIISEFKAIKPIYNEFCEEKRGGIMIQSCQHFYIPAEIMLFNTTILKRRLKFYHSIFFL